MEFLVHMMQSSLVTLDEDDAMEFLVHMPL